MKIFRSCLFLLFSLCVLPVFSQEQEGAITVRGTVFDLADTMASPAPMAVNRRTGAGQSALAGQWFSVQGLHTDTFMVTAGGYEIVRICFRDSARKAVYNVRIGLKMKVNTLRPVAIYPAKDLKTLRNERESLGVKETRMTSAPADAFQSPITALYERYSREGQSRAKVAYLENEDRKREILHQLLNLYVKAGVVELKPEEFDTFIDYLDIPDHFLQNASDYQLATAIRERWFRYEQAKQMHNHQHR
ncbi:MAG: hypothetical protein MUC87_16835 [Bacteroidia bacterium]|jgi:hypothetical protein|nr:hypothetical protein [Bacteroidia bacterium]